MGTSTLIVLAIIVVVVLWAILSGIDAVITLSAVSRAVLTFASLIVLSGVWWALLAYWRGKRGERGAGT